MRIPEKPSLGFPAPRVDASGGPDAIPHEGIFFSAVQTTRMPMIITDPHQPDNPIIFANEAFLNMSGYSLGEVVGRNCRFMQGAETSRRTVAEIRRAIDNAEDIACEILNYRKDGSSFWNALFISPVLGTSGELMYFFASQLDVSRRRDAEDALRQAQKMEAVGQLTGGVAHDFNNLLQVLGGHIDLARAAARRAGAADARMMLHLDKAKGSVVKASTLTSQLLAFSRKQRLDGRVINLNDPLRSMLELARRSIGEGVTILEDFEPGLWNCRVDPTQTEVAVLNLLLNARHAMHDQGTVTVSSANVEVGADGPSGAALAPGRWVSITVTDTGEGIPAEVLPHVMEPFFTTKAVGDGTGLGLSMVYGFVKQSSGVVHIESDVGVGTSVTMSFPAVGEAPEEMGDVADAAAGPVTARSGRILVVDDRVDVAEVAASMLANLGYRAVCHTSPSSALEMLKNDASFDVLLSDVVMPGNMNGVDLARQARKVRPDLKVLLATGYTEATLDRSTARGGQFEVIHKPYDAAELASKLHALVGPTSRHDPVRTDLAPGTEVKRG